VKDENDKTHQRKRYGVVARKKMDDWLRAGREAIEQKKAARHLRGQARQAAKEGMHPNRPTLRRRFPD
jgi:hypothetical protein